MIPRKVSDRFDTRPSRNEHQNRGKKEGYKQKYHRWHSIFRHTFFGYDLADTVKYSREKSQTST
ncbi:uncharacterized protein METZ01_LOCUS132874 [marine metagenome]|uniref:Uncharacterized protein n=1 Tax=marine metagenome TaxID=408172 RepID=A0A381YST9_9ZZZZ